MFSYEDRIRAVRLYLKLGKRIGATIRQLGYPTRILSKPGIANTSSAMIYGLAMAQTVSKRVGELLKPGPARDAACRLQQVERQIPAALIAKVQQAP